jgi:uncharacterized protein (DUF362 family)/ferredoxin
MTQFDLAGLPVWSAEAWTPAEVRSAVEACLDTSSAQLPPPGELVFIKPDVGSDRSGLSGGTTDFRVLVALLEALRDRGHHHLLMGDAAPPAYVRARVEPARRLRLDRLCTRFGVRWLDLNRGPAVQIHLPAGEVKVARVALDAALLIDLASVRTHPDAGLALGAFNLRGVIQSPYRTKVATSPAENLVALAERIRPGITLIDALIAMEGDGPLDGSPVRLGRLFWGRDLLAVDLLVARLLGYTAEEVTHLWWALRQGILPLEAVIAVESRVSVLRDLRRPRWRGAARRTGQMIGAWVRRSIQARSEARGWSAVADWMQVRTQVDPRDDTLHGLRRDPENCGSCRRCEEFCPVGLTREQIGLEPAHDRCIGCLYCYQVCGRDALSLQGEGGALIELLNRDRLPLVAM